MSLKPVKGGWLEKQIELAQQSMAQWPEWMRRAAVWQGSGAEKLNAPRRAPSGGA